MKAILVLTDFSENSKAAAEAAAKLADKMGAEVLLFNAFVTLPLVTSFNSVPLPQAYYDSIKIENDDKLNAEFSRLQLVFSKHGYGPERIKLDIQNREGSLAENVQSILKEKNIVMVVMGARNQKNINFLSGSDIAEVLNVVNCPVLIVPRNRKELNIKNVIFATDLGSEDMDALKWLLNFTDSFKCHIHVSHVKQPAIWIPDFKEEDRIAEFVNHVVQLNVPNVSYKNLESDYISKELHQFSEKIRADLMTLIHRKHSFFWKLFYEAPCRDLVSHQDNLLLILPGHWKNNSINNHKKIGSVVKKRHTPLL